MRHLFILFAFAIRRFAATIPPAKRVRVSEPDEAPIVDHHNYTLVIERLGIEFAQSLRIRMRYDMNLSYFPDPENSRTQATPLGILHLGQVLASAQQSVIYTVIGRDDILIKYQANCFEVSDEDGSNVHPLIVDAWFGLKAARNRVGPAIRFLSSPGPICTQKTGKCAFDMDDEEEFVSCRDNPRGTLRYIIMDRVPGRTLHQFKDRFPNGIVPFDQAIQIGHMLIQYLQALHNISRVVHGDIHLSNIMINMSNGTLAMKLIDFGRSFANVARPIDRIRESGWAINSVLTSWEMDGYASAPRDDVARAVYVIAQLVHSGNLAAYEDRMECVSIFFGPEGMIDYKENENFFALQLTALRNGTMGDPVDALNIPIEHKTDIKDLLSSILILVREMENVNSIPPYREILNRFQDIYSIYREGVRRYRIATTTLVPSEH